MAASNNINHYHHYQPSTNVNLLLIVVKKKSFPLDLSTPNPSKLHGYIPNKWGGGVIMSNIILDDCGRARVIYIYIYIYIFKIIRHQPTNRSVVEKPSFVIILISFVAPPPPPPLSTPSSAWTSAFFPHTPFSVSLSPLILLSSTISSLSIPLGKIKLMFRLFV